MPSSCPYAHGDPPAAAPPEEHRQGPDRAPAPGSWLYVLERFDIGVVQLDRELRVVGMNEAARRCLPVAEKMPFGKIVTSFHPESSQSKVQFLLGEAECPVNNAPPMTMMINIPDRVLLIKLSKLGDASGATVGYTLVFYDITDAVSHEIDPLHGRDGVPSRRLLRKIPTIRQNRVLLIDVADVCFVRAEGHYTWVHTRDRTQFCNITISDLESRLDPGLFLRVHRSYIVNLSFVEEIVRDDGRMTLHMAGAEQARIPVSRGSAPALLEQLGLPGAPAAKR
ncbi:LytTR family transcriptional regulator DNA-binding domain-containing protein [Pigmentiphaga soli]|uniref:LytTR family transcriptional regulator DNA-binding domain-containing protein n=1 Tax=Pigmentiphaga soli TaxID=1007095 RepID=A0ABP8H516_9BURK